MATRVPLRSIEDRVAEAEANAGMHLGNYNEEIERGAVKTAEKSLRKAQFWLDRLNDLLGQGSR
jgi:hypothetical protein